MSIKEICLMIITTILQLVWMLVAWFLLPFMFLFAYKVPSTNVPYKSHLEIQRYRLPKIFAWADLFDDHGIGGVMYEPTVYRQYKRYGLWVSAYIQLAFRNVGHGILYLIHKPVSNYLVHLSEEQQRKEGVYRKEYPFLWFKLVIGHSIYRMWKDDDTDIIWDHTFIAIPKIGLRWRNDK